MDYPLLLVPHIGGSWLIGAVAIFHVIIAHFAIGGGLLTVVTEQLGARRENALWMAFARKHAVFLVLLSSVLGALSGFGIWFTVGLVHPAAVASLIHNFVWGWAIELIFYYIKQIVKTQLVNIGKLNTQMIEIQQAIQICYRMGGYIHNHGL